MGVWGLGLLTMLNGKRTGSNISLGVIFRNQFSEKIVGDGSFGGGVAGIA